MSVSLTSWDVGRHTFLKPGLHSSGIMLDRGRVGRGLRILMLGVCLVCRPPSNVLSATSVNRFAVANFKDGSAVMLFEVSGSMQSSMLVSCWLFKVIDVSRVGRGILL